MKKLFLAAVAVVALVGSFVIPTKAMEKIKVENTSEIEVKGLPIQKVPFSHTHYFDTQKTKAVTIWIEVDVISIGGEDLVNYIEGSGKCELKNVKGGTARLLSEGSVDNSDGTTTVNIAFSFTPTNGTQKKYTASFKIDGKYLNNVTVI